MNLQHVNFKLRIDTTGMPDLAPLIPVFHSWIRGQVFGDLLLDIADYRHVPAGPGVIVIGQAGDYSVDQTDNRVGVRYNRKAPLEGSNQQRLQQAARAALIAAQRLETENALGGAFRFNGRDIDFFLNDRLLAPNRESTREEAQPELDEFFSKLFDGSDYSLNFDRDPRRLFSASVKSARLFTVAELLSNLQSA
jgi:hypothetical protein